MVRTYLILVVAFLIFSCKTKSQEHNVFKSIQLFAEGGDSAAKGLAIEFEDSIKAFQLYRQAIEKFEQAYAADSTNLQLGCHLSQLYSKTGDYHKALYWALKMQPFYQTSKVARAGSLKDIGFCYLNLGDIEQGSIYIKKALIIDPRIDLLAHGLTEIAKKITNQKNVDQVTVLRSKGLNPCVYAVKILQFGRTLYTRVESKVFFPQEKINDIKKNCR